MAFPDSFIRELSERCDIVEIVSSYVRMTKRSGANQFGLCPFHSEKTPSFSVNAEKQIYHCFGCGKGGSVIGFIMEMENLSFPEAVHFLARRAGMQVPEGEFDENRKRRQRMLQLGLQSARFFHEMFIAEGGQKAREYVAARGISPAMARTFGLGFAPDSWDALIREMKAKGFTESELQDAGLVRRGKNGGIYDAFRNRLMFPVIDLRGQVIGFSGRILGDGEPKYLNSPETLVFNKSRNLFALNLAKKSKSGYIVLTEGNIDVVALHQAGFDSAVASLGTSLTAEQGRLISRFTSKVIIAYDADGAGQNAARRAIGILEKLDLNVHVLRLQGANDPDEFIKIKGAEAFQKLIERAENHVEYRLSDARRKYDLELDEEKVLFLREATQILADISGRVEREVYIMRVADLCGVSKEAVGMEAARVRKKRSARERLSRERDALRPARSAQPKAKGIRFQNIRSARAEEGIIRLLFLDPSLASIKELPEPGDFSSEMLGKIYQTLGQRIREGEEVSLPLLSQYLTPDEFSHLSSVLQKPENLSVGDRTIKEYIEIVMNNRVKAAADIDSRALAEKLREKKGYGG